MQWKVRKPELTVEQDPLSGCHGPSHSAAPVPSALPVCWGRVRPHLGLRRSTVKIAVAMRRADDAADGEGGK